jgi:cytochrome P450
MLNLPVPPATGPDADLLTRTARWSNPPDHAGRRAAAEALLAAVPVAEAASAAARAASGWLRALPYERVDVLPLFRIIPLTVLATLLRDDGSAATGILIQSRDATAALASARLTGRSEAPVRCTRRVQGAGIVEVPLEDHPFGAGAHACPGRTLAEALADAMVSAVLADWRPVPEEPAFDPALPNVRLPPAVFVERR